MISDPIDFAHGVVDIVQQNLTDPGPATRQLGAPIGEPAIVGLESGQAPLVLRSRRSRRHQATRREKGRDRIRVNDLAHNAVGLEGRLADCAVPVPIRLGRGQVTKRVGVASEPPIELFMEL
jgi:hypothetical protein